MQIAINQKATEKLKTDISEAGSVDAGLALIPTTLFFIILLQIVLTGSWQVMERAKLHDYMIRESIFGEMTNSHLTDGVINLSNREVESKKQGSDYGVISTYISEQRIPVFGSLLAHLGIENFKLKLSAIAVE